MEGLSKPSTKKPAFYIDPTNLFQENKPLHHSLRKKYSLRVEGGDALENPFTLIHMFFLTRERRERKNVFWGVTITKGRK